MQETFQVCNASHPKVTILGRGLTDLAFHYHLTYSLSFISHSCKTDLAETGFLYTILVGF